VGSWHASLPHWLSLFSLQFLLRALERNLVNKVAENIPSLSEDSELDRKTQAMTFGLSRFRGFCNGKDRLGLEKWQPC